VGQVVVLEFTGRLGDVVEDLDRAIEHALAEEPRGVICDLTTVTGGAEPAALSMLASAGRHVRDWPAIPVAVACPDWRVREALAADPRGGQLILTASMPPAASAVLATPVPDVRWLRLTPHPTSPRASRNFVTRTLLEWGLDPLVHAACLVVSELVTNSIIHAGTDIELSVAWHLGALRLTVRDNSPDLPRPRIAHFGEHGRGLTVVTALSRAFGVLPSATGGKVVWAVINAARPHPPTSPPLHEAATTCRPSSPALGRLG
jgi:anti-sigma regulatory factor (Ser/Thr protein kinase)